MNLISNWYEKFQLSQGYVKVSAMESLLTTTLLSQGIKVDVAKLINDAASEAIANVRKAEAELTGLNKSIGTAQEQANREIAAIQEALAKKLDGINAKISGTQAELAGLNLVASKFSALRDALKK